MDFSLPQLSRDDTESLIAVLSLKEVREVLFFINVDSALGPTSFALGFSHVSWDTIKADSLVVVQNSFKRGYLPRDITSIVIVLIWKMEGASQCQDF